MLHHENESMRWVLTLLGTLSAASVVVVVVARRIESRKISQWNKTASFVPFISLNEIDWTRVDTQVGNYRREMNRVLESLSHSLQVAVESEERQGLPPLLSTRIQEKIRRLADLYEKQHSMIQAELLRPFPMLCALPPPPSPMTSSPSVVQSCDSSQNTAAKTTSFQILKRKGNFVTSSGHYEAATQIVAHLVRDWTKEGSAVRQAVYDWCRQQVPVTNRILVPGSGAGRLAYDLALDGHRVEANECSLSMLALCYRILIARAQGTIYPYIVDALTSEVDSERRYDSVRFPDVVVRALTAGSLSFTHGDFLTVYDNVHNRYGCIVTCFFIDTATNVYDYVDAIWRLITVGGRWVNIGPLLWHRNTVLGASADELRHVLEHRWKIITWKVDHEPIDYRADESHRSTHFDAYCPIRFVAVKR